MFANFGWEHMLVLLVVGLVVLGPERLPGAIRWGVNALRQAREYINGATGNLREEFGPEFDDLREPFSELQKLRGMNPRTALTKHLLDGDDSLFTGIFDAARDVAAAPPAPAVPAPSAASVPLPPAPVPPVPAASVPLPPAPVPPAPASAPLNRAPDDPASQRSVPSFDSDAT